MIPSRIGEGLLERGLVPDALVRRAVRARLGRLLAREAALAAEAGGDEARLRLVAASLRRQPIAIHTDDANRQHYELPADFYRLFLGPRMKYSCCLWPPGVDDLAAAEEASLAQVCERAGVGDGQAVLDLGCGWGALTLYVAERFPGCHVTAVSNSRSQGRHVTAEAARLGLGNVVAETADIAAYSPARRFDRILSLEMLEHVRDYEAAFASIAGWLQPAGRVFAHVFAHTRYAYTFSTGPANWMGRLFFSGGTMPSHGLFRHFDRDLCVIADWRLDGTHYARTLESWLACHDAHAGEVRAVLSGTGDQREVRGRSNNNRVFLMACAETFAYAGGSEWGVSHYLMAPADRAV